MAEATSPCVGTATGIVSTGEVSEAAWCNVDDGEMLGRLNRDWKCSRASVLLFQSLSLIRVPSGAVIGHEMRMSETCNLQKLEKASCNWPVWSRCSPSDAILSAQVWRSHLTEALHSFIRFLWAVESPRSLASRFVKIRSLIRSLIQTFFQ